MVMIYACFLGYNFLTEDPTLSFIGILLLMLVVIPKGEPWSLGKKQTTPWVMPYFVFWGMIFTIGLGYTISGLDKLSGTSWINGSAMYYLYDVT